MLFKLETARAKFLDQCQDLSGHKLTAVQKGLMATAEEKNRRVEDSTRQVNRAQGIYDQKANEAANLCDGFRGECVYSVFSRYFNSIIQ